MDVLFVYDFAGGLFKPKDIRFYVVFFSIRSHIGIRITRLLRT